jgi:hypothetical protein
VKFKIQTNVLVIRNNVHVKKELLVNNGIEIKRKKIKYMKEYLTILNWHYLLVESKGSFIFHDFLLLCKNYAVFLSIN